MKIHFREGMLFVWCDSSEEFTKLRDETVKIVSSPELATLNHDDVGRIEIMVAPDAEPEPTSMRTILQAAGCWLVVTVLLFVFGVGIASIVRWFL